MIEITRERLHAYLDDALTEVETAQVEQALRLRTFASPARSDDAGARSR